MNKFSDSKLEIDRLAYFKSISKLSSSELNNQSHGWSILQHLYHCYLVESLANQYIAKKILYPETINKVSLLTYFKSCSIDSEVERIKKEQRILNSEIDTLSSQLVNEEEMIYLIKTVPAWKTLRIEEISDKERISINALEEKED